MAQWKKVIVSGSTAALSGLSVDNAIVANLTGTATTASYVAFGNVDGLTAFSSSVATRLLDTQFDLTIAADSGTSNKVGDGETLTIHGGSNITTTVNDNIVTASLDANITLTSVTASLLGNVVGNVTGTTSTASYVAGGNVKGTVASATSASYSSVAQTANLATLATNATNATNAVTAQTASFVNADEVEFISGNGQTLTTVSASLSSRIAQAQQAGYSASFIATTGQTGITWTDSGTGTATQVSATVVGLGTTANVTFATASITQNLAVGGTLGVIGNATVGGNVVIDGNLTTLGTVTNINTTDLAIEDKYILLNSGSTAANAGIIVGKLATGIGTALFWDNTAERWATDFEGADPINDTATADAHIAMVTTTGSAAYSKTGNIRVEGGEIYIYV